MCALYDLKQEEIDSSDPADYRLLKQSLAILESPLNPSPKHRIEAAGNWYQLVNLNPAKMTVEMYRDLMGATDLYSDKSRHTLTNILSLLIRPVKPFKIFGKTFWLKSRQDKTKLDQYENDLREASITDLFSLLKFFEVLHAEIIRNLLTRHKEKLITAGIASGKTREETEAELQQSLAILDECFPLTKKPGK